MVDGPMVGMAWADVAQKKRLNCSPKLGGSWEQCHAHIMAIFFSDIEETEETRHFVCFNNAQLAYEPADIENSDDISIQNGYMA